MLYVTFTSFKTSFLSFTIWYFSWFDRFSNCWDNCFRAGRKNRNAVLSILYVFRVACSTLIHSLSLSTSEEPRICTVSFQKWNHRELTKVHPLQTRHLISMWLWVLVLCWPWCWLSMLLSSSVCGYVSGHCHVLVKCIVLTYVPCCRTYVCLTA